MAARPGCGNTVVSLRTQLGACRRRDLIGRTVAITGGCGGLGIALAGALRAKQANVALLDLDADGVKAQAERLGDVRVARGRAADVRIWRT